MANDALDALRELVTLKDMKDGFGVEPFGEHNNEAARADYKRRKPVAWARARAIVNAASTSIKVFLCRASGEGSHNFRVCTTEDQVHKFYAEMFGEDVAGEGFLKSFRDPDEWAMGVEYRENLYNARFEVWKVDHRDLEIRSATPSSEALDACSLELSQARVDLEAMAARLVQLEAQSANTALSDVAAERRRQVEKEGWSHEHDDGHVNGAMAVAGACYALYAASRITTEHPSWKDRYAGLSYELWPWDEEWRKPKDTRRDLIRAAALIVAEIERLDRQIHSADRCVKPE